MKHIQLSNGVEAIVNDIDYNWLSEYSWSQDQDGYAKTNIKKDDGKYTTVRMHRLIMGRPKGVKVDHIDGNRLNNDRNNLRICNDSQNQWNRKPNKVARSIYKGVSCYYDYYRVYITANRKTIYVGSYRDEVAAANAYNHKAKELFGEFARPNEVTNYMSEDECNNNKVKTKKHSRFRGVCFSKNRWVACINVDGKRHYLGRFNTEEEAASAYNNKAMELLGDDAVLNNLERGDVV